MLRGVFKFLRCSTAAGQRAEKCCCTVGGTYTKYLAIPYSVFLRPQGRGVRLLVYTHPAEGDGSGDNSSEVGLRNSSPTRMGTGRARTSNSFCTNNRGEAQRVLTPSESDTSLHMYMTPSSRLKHSILEGRGATCLVGGKGSRPMRLTNSIIRRGRGCQINSHNKHTHTHTHTHTPGSEGLACSPPREH